MKIRFFSTINHREEIITECQKFVDENFSDAYDFLNRYDVFSQWFEKSFGYFCQHPDFELM